MELSGSPASVEWCRRSLFRFEGVHSALALLGVLCSGGSSSARSRTARRRRVVDTVAPFENCIASTSIFVLPSYKEPTVDALASTTDEGRVRLRKANIGRVEGTG